MSIEYTIKDNFDYVLEEKGNTYISLRKLCWCGADEEARNAQRKAH